MGVNEIELAYVKSTGEAKSYLSKGYEPVECSFGEFGTVVGPLVLDHHGEYSREEPVSVKAAKLSLHNDWEPLKKFVVAGMADPDAVYTILVLSKAILPNLRIAEAIGELDVDPIGIDRNREPYIRVPAFEMQYKTELNKEGFMNALEIGTLVFDDKPLGKDLEEKAKIYEEHRISDVTEKIIFSKNDVVFLERDGPSRDIAHSRGSIVVQYKPSLNVLTISGLSREGAERVGKRNIYEIFGPLGLKFVYPKIGEIVGKGIGGREEIGGGPRHAKISREQAMRVFDLIVNLSSPNY